MLWGVDAAGALLDLGKLQRVKDGIADLHVAIVDKVAGQDLLAAVKVCYDNVLTVRDRVCYTVSW